MHVLYISSAFADTARCTDNRCATNGTCNASIKENHIPKKKMNRLGRDWEQGVNSMRYRIFYTGLYSCRSEDGVLTLKQFKSVVVRYQSECPDEYAAGLPTSLQQWLDFMGASLIDSRASARKKQHRLTKIQGV